MGRDREEKYTVTKIYKCGETIVEFKGRRGGIEGKSTVSQKSASVW
jgi:hypothetical protein